MGVGTDCDLGFRLGILAFVAVASVEEASSAAAAVAAAAVEQQCIAFALVAMALRLHGDCKSQFRLCQQSTS